METSVEDLVRRWPSIKWFAGIGTVCIIAGGLVAAVSRPLDFDDGPWLAAYLVLVSGVAQVALGLGQAMLSGEAPQLKLVVREAVTWNVGSALVIAGSLSGSPMLTTIGGVILAVSLALFVYGVAEPARVALPWLLWLYRGLAVFVLLSVPVGLVLSWTRHA